MKLSVADIRGAVRVTSSKDKVLPANADTIAKLKEKHPSPHQGSILPPPPEGEDCLVVTWQDIKIAIKSFCQGSGGGHDGLLPQDLKDLTGEELGSQATTLLDCLVDFVNNIILQGIVPSMICPIFYGAKLILYASNCLNPAFVRLAAIIAEGKCYHHNVSQFWARKW